MYTFLYKIYFSLRRIQKETTFNNWRNKLATKIIGYIEAYYNLYVVKQYRKHYSATYGVTKDKRKQKIIVSLTSYPGRISTTWIAVETLLRQSMKPDEIILWLAREQFPSMEDVPIELRNQQARGLTIRFCDDLKSHKKYFYVMQEYPDDIVILADDDIFYAKDLVKILWKFHQKTPEEIISMTAAKIYPHFDSNPSGWKKVGAKEHIEHSYVAQAYTGSGSLYPPGSISEKAFDKHAISTLCPSADDLWLKFFSLVNGTRTTEVYPFRFFEIMIYDTQKSSLWNINGPDGGANDRQWHALVKNYPEEFQQIEKLK